MIRKNISFLEPFLVDPEVLSWNPSSKALNLTKKLVDVLRIIKEDPKLLKNEDVRNMIWDKDSQIGDKDRYYFHISNTAGIYQQLVEELCSKHPDLDLPDPETARVLGLVHDLSKIYSKYNHNFKQYDQELTLYFHSRYLGLNTIANNVAMHSAYWEILEMIKEGSGFHKVNLYRDWTSALNDTKNPLFFDNIKSFFDIFLKGKDNLPLIALTVADHIENGKPNFSLNSFNEDFISRTSDIINRYYLKRILDSKEPTVFGYALMKRGGLERVLLYKNIVIDLLQGNFDKYKETSFVKTKK